jgi:hypothetical protein
MISARELHQRINALQISPSDQREWIKILLPIILGDSVEGGYATIEDLADALTSYVETDTLSDYVETTALTTTLGGYVETDVLTDYTATADLPFINVREHGVTGDGTTDESVAIQAVIDANKGRRILFPRGYQYKCKGISLDGATYNGTQLAFDGELLLAPAPLPGSATFGGKWIGLLIRLCDNIEITFRGHGNRANQPDSEHQVVLAIAGATNVRIPLCIIREVRSDGVNINQATYSSSTAMASGIQIGQLHVTNSADDGRNAISVISGEDIQVGNTVSVNVGGTVGGSLMPGGVDIEPNHSWSLCRRIQFGQVSVTGAGAANFAVQGIHGSDTTYDVSVASLLVRNTSVATINDAAGNMTQTSAGCILVAKARDVSIPDAQLSYLNAYGDAISVTQSDRVNIRATAKHVRTGAQLGVLLVGGSVNYDVTRSRIHCDAEDVSRRGFSMGHMVDTTVTGSVRAPVTGMYTTSLMAVFTLRVNAAQPIVRCRISVDVPYAADWVRAYWNDNTLPQTFTDCLVENCTVRGFTDTLGAGSLDVKRNNVDGVTNRDSIPTGGTWQIGQFVRANTSTVGAGKLLLGWYRLTSGTAHVSGTDWTPIYGTDS